ncbi:hypothetical protein K227x_61960 [Rubripirellula lacrimiformis]|uniref:Uncharacterized protein n=1 Tax=Rubripirellula lacrimiformis TaxID=1930273 RepID=A0A517NKV1_9BACT|nr:hypothetical protein K227x_61960 [Rubripirellula lacrimiformis]
MGWLARTHPGATSPPSTQFQTLSFKHSGLKFPCTSKGFAPEIQAVALNNKNPLLRVNLRELRARSTAPGYTIHPTAEVGIFRRRHSPAHSGTEFTVTVGRQRVGRDSPAIPQTPASPTPRASRGHPPFLDIGDGGSYGLPVSRTRLQPLRRCSSTQIKLVGT